MKMDFLETDLARKEQLGLRRFLKEINSPQAKEIVLNNRKILNFASNDYLGLANDERLKEAAIEAIRSYGVGAGSARLICGNMTAHEKLEEELALFKQTQAALVFSSGYTANGGIISALMDRGTVVFCDRLNHASIIDGIILSRAQLWRYPHADMQALEELLKKSRGVKRKLIVTDTVFSMDGDKAPLEEIVMLAQRYEAMVMVDEAHGFGVLGHYGGGLVEELGLQGEIPIQMGTLSKAAGGMGAYVCGEKILREYLINRSRTFIYTTAMPPALAETARVALRIIRHDHGLRQSLLENARYLRQALKADGFDTMNSTTPIIPLLVKDPVKAVEISKTLLKQGIFVQAIRPPTVPVGTARLRLTVTAKHTRSDLDRLLCALKGL